METILLNITAMRKIICALLIVLPLYLNGQCPTTDITLASQADVDNFATNYPGCTSSATAVVMTITGADIVNLNGLSGITYWGGGIKIMNNPMLNDVTGLSNLTSIGANGSSFSGLIVEGNPLLPNLNGLNAVTTINGQLEIVNNAVLTNFDALSSYTGTAFGGSATVRIENNPLLTSVAGLNGLTNYGNNFSIINNPMLITIALNAVTSANLGLTIKDNPALTSVSFSALTTVGGTLRLDNNDMLANFNGFSALTSVGVGGFGGEGLSFDDNAVLTDISAFANLNSNYSFLSIENNPQLAVCHVTSICSYVSSNAATSTITGNSTTCASIAAVQTACCPTPTITTNDTDNIICSGASVTLTASMTGATAYSWSSGQNTAAIMVSPTSTTTYTVTVTAGSCMTSASQVITVNNPTATITSSDADNTICSGQSVTLTSSSATSYMWSTSETTMAISPSPTTTTTYGLTVTDAAGCTATSSQAITVNTPPTVTISSSDTDNTICTGQSVGLTASMGSSYMWSTGATTQAITPMPTANTTYTVTVTDANGCTGTAMQMITVNPAPTANINSSDSDNAICPGESVTLTASGGTSYMWSTSETTAAITVMPTSTTTYTVTVTDANGCTATKSQAITISGGTASLAALTSPVTTASAAQTLVGTPTGGTYSGPGVTGNMFNPATAGPGTHTITYTTGGTCPGMATQTVTVILDNCTTQPTCITVNISTGLPLNIPATGMGTYSVNFDNVTTNLTITDVNILNVKGNHAKPTDLHMYLESPKGTYKRVYAQSCSTTPFDFTIDDAYSDVVGSGPGGCGSATTTGFGKSNDINTSMPTLSDFNGEKSTGQWKFHVEDLFDGDGGQLTGVALQICGSATPTSMSLPASTCVTGNAINLAPLATPSGGSFSGTGVSGAAGSQVFTPSTAGVGMHVITYSVMDPNCNAVTITCTDTINVTSGPTFMITSSDTDNTICAGQSVGLTASMGASYAWSTGATTQAITPSPTMNTTYTVTVTDAGGCTGTASQLITVNPAPTANITSSDADNTICTGESVTLTASGGTSYVWSTTATTAAITVMPTATTTYTVTVTDANGCTATKSQVITIGGGSTTLNALTSPVTTASAAQTLVGAPTGGTYSGPGVVGNMFNPAMAGAGTHTITYTTSGACASTATQMVVVTLDNCAAQPTCVTVNVSTGLPLNIPATGMGTYTVNFDNVTTNLTITDVNIMNVEGTHSLPSDLHMYLESPKGTYKRVYSQTCGGSGSGVTNFHFNIDDAYNDPPNNTNGCGTPGGMVINGKSVDINTNMTTLGDFNGEKSAGQWKFHVEDLFDGDGGQLTNVRLQICGSATPTSMNLPASTCVTGPSINLAPLATPAGGTFSGTGVAGTVGSQTFSPATAGVGMHVITYTIMDPNCNAVTIVCTDTINVTAAPTFSITSTDTDNTICSGTSIGLTASMGASYLWSTGATTQAITPSPTMTTTYTVTVTDTNGCTGTASQSVTVNSLPSPSINSSDTDNTICSGESVTLTASGGTAYAWSTSQSISAIMVSPTTTTNYTVTVTDANGCTATSSQMITVNPLPTPSITSTDSDNTICIGESIGLTASSATSYNWSSGENTQAITPSPNMTTTYVVTVTDANGCTATSSQMVTVNPLPTPMIVSSDVDNTICQGESFTLTASGGTSYQWSNASNSATINLTPTTTTNYTVTVTDANGCSATSSYTMTVNPLPNVNISSNDIDNTICEGDSITLTASGGTTYNWSSGQSTAMITVLPTSMTNYIVTVTDANGCTNTASQLVNVNANPMATITSSDPDNMLCESAGVALTANGGVSYNWSTGVQTQAIVAFPTQTSTYTVTVTDANGCQDSESQTISIVPGPGATITSSDADNIICGGNSVDLTVAGNGIYSWSTGQTSSTISVMPTSTTTYSVTVTAGNGCTSTAEQEITVTSSSSAAITTDETDNAICVGEDIVLTAMGGSAFVWSTGASTSSITVSPTMTTTYQVTVSDGTTCSAEATQEIIVHPAFNGTITSDDADNTICSGTSIQLTANGGDTYLWSNGATTNQISETPSADTNYQVTITNSNGCMDTVSQMISIIPAISTSISSSIAGFTVCDGQAITLEASGNFSFNWSDGSTSNQITVNPTSPTMYSVTATDANGCTTTAQQEVTINTGPNFTINSSDNDNTICSGQSINLEASNSSFSSYQWSSGATTSAITVQPTSNTTYTLTVTDANGCTAEQMQLVNVTNISVSLNPIAGPLNTNSGIQTLVGMPVPGNGETGVFSGPGVSGNTFNPQVAGVGTHMVTYTFTDSEGCTGMSTQSIVVNTEDCDKPPGCFTYAAQGLPLVISDTLEINEFVSVSFEVTENIFITDVNVMNIEGMHTAPADMHWYLESPSGKVRRIYSQTCGAPNTVFNMTIDDAFPQAPGFSGSCGTPGGAVESGRSVDINTGNPTLGDFNGELARGTWKFIVEDLFAGDGGSITGITLQICGSTTPVQINSEDKVCIGAGPITLSGEPSGGTFSGNGVVNNTFDPNGLSPGAYVIEYAVPDPECKSVILKTQKTITVSNVDASISSNNSNSIICPGETVELTASGGTVYNWSNGLRTASINVMPDMTTSYAVTVTDDAGCSDVESIQIQTHSQPVATISSSDSDNSICIGDQVRLTATGGNAYMWSTGNTNAAIDVTPMTSTNYTVTVTDSNGCTNTSALQITVNPLPTANITGNDPDFNICEGDSIRLTASGGVSFMWSDNSTSSTIAVGPSSNTTYSVTVTDANGCMATAQQEVTVTNINNVTLRSSDIDNQICVGESVQLSVFSTGTFLWSTGENSSQINVTPTTTTTYSVTVTNNNCTRVASQEIVVNPLPVIALQTTNCTSDSTFWSASVSAENINTINASSGSISGTSPNFIISNIPVGTNITVNGTNPTTGCTGELSINSPDCSCPMVAVPTATNKTICVGEAVPELEVNVGMGMTANWYDMASGGNLLLGDSLKFRPNVMAIGVYTYYVESKEISSGCISAVRIPVVLTISEIPSAFITSDETDNQICQGEDVVITGNGGSSYVWSNGKTTNSITELPNSTTTYTVTVTNSNGCSSTASYEINVIPQPNAAITSSTGQFGICNGQSISLIVPAGNSYSWSNGAATNSITVNPINPTTYTVLVTDSNGCTSSSAQEISINAVPAVNVVIPNLICSGTDFLLIENGGAATSWNWDINATFQNMGDSIMVQGGTLTNNNFTLTVTDNNGCTATQAVELNVTSSPVFTSEFLIPKEACVGDSVKMLEHSNLNFTPSRVVWDFGDGTTSNELFPWHVYNTEGTFMVTVEIFSGDCSVKSIVKSIMIDDCKNLLSEGDHFVSIYTHPNPKVGDSPTDIIFESQTTQSLDYYISNGYGQIVRKGFFENKSKNLVRFDHLEPGIYFVFARWLSSKQTKRYKFVIID